MGSRVHESLYDKAMYELEELITCDPDYESVSDEEFIEALTESSPSGFTTREASRIASLYRKYCSD